MNIDEYKKVKEFKYKEYCNYLKSKYGEAKFDYFTKNYNKNTRVTRTEEGLVCHHICEDKAILLSTPDYAKRNPFDYQKAENLVYCDYLEHLFLHILICENPAEDRNEYEAVGIGGVVNYLIPELNDIYSGFVSVQQWRENCYNRIREDKKVYIELVKRFKTTCSNYPLYDENLIYKSFNAPYGLWSNNKNKLLYEELKK